MGGEQLSGQRGYCEGGELQWVTGTCRGNNKKEQFNNSLLVEVVSCQAEPVFTKQYYMRESIK